eukprot:TRINITY_DN8995_c0_g1_i2.p1 TRINITY_DN8995_c0_g1~~TRINITY_DN8995_c0_g1_i2.p1  ORF type:complete len:222 (+),score=24.77 TRINITY_DN8995_c0_g1_i2:100-666(+)
MEDPVIDLVSYCTETFDPLIDREGKIRSTDKKEDRKEMNATKGNTKNLFMALPIDTIVVIFNQLDHGDVVRLASSCKSLLVFLQDARIRNKDHIHTSFFLGLKGAKEMRKIPWMMGDKRNYFIDSPKKPYFLRNTIAKLWQWEEIQNEQIRKQLQMDRKNWYAQIFAFGDMSKQLDDQLQSIGHRVGT